MGDESAAGLRARLRMVMCDPAELGLASSFPNFDGEFFCFEMCFLDVRRC